MSAGGERSSWMVRTPANPRGFTYGEFAYGAVMAWVYFQPLGLIAGVVLSFVDADPGQSIGGAFGLSFFGLFFSVPTLVLGSPLAHLLGFLLRRVGNDVVHVVAFAAYGAAVGVATMAAWFGGAGGLAVALTVALAAASAVAVPLGWWTTSRKALRRDVRRAMLSRSAVEPETVGS